MKPEFIHKTRLSQIAVQRIKEIIQSEKLEPGDRLPPERHLIGQFGISRTSIREALKNIGDNGFHRSKGRQWGFYHKNGF
jgi:DNA-binding FadR family transcriptional regulator